MEDESVVCDHGMHTGLGGCPPTRPSTSPHLCLCEVGGPTTAQPCRTIDHSARLPRATSSPKPPRCTHPCNVNYLFMWDSSAPATCHASRRCTGEAWGWQGRDLRGSGGAGWCGDSFLLGLHGAHRLGQLQGRPPSPAEASTSGVAVPGAIAARVGEAGEGMCPRPRLRQGSRRGGVPCGGRSCQSPSRASAEDIEGWAFLASTTRPGATRLGCDPAALTGLGLG
jgi:hypothetical protein